MSARGRLAAAAGLPLLIALPGCAALGGNVRGDFACVAPDGICAPSSSIDDHALALISGEEPSEPADHKASGQAPGRARRKAASPSGVPAGVPVGVVAARTQERVLRIVFQAYVDDRGRLHEASAVHAVVAHGEWRPIADQGELRPGLAISSPGAAAIFADTFDRLDPLVSPGLDDPAGPDPAAVAAARARKPDPVAAIKADVAERLAPQSARRSGPPGETSKALGRHDEGDAAIKHAGAAIQPAAGAEKAVLARIKASPDYAAAAEVTAQQVRSAAGESTVKAPPPPAATIRTSAFPAAVPVED